VIAAFKPTENETEVKNEMAIYVGIDVHKKYCQAALLNDNGRVIQELRYIKRQSPASKQKLSMIFTATDRQSLNPQSPFDHFRIK
jgi:activator of 2-hydroxyglutaryl-CoA dehydratase